MKKVLWISRNNMTPEQTTDLARIYDGKVEVEQYTETISSVKEIIELADKAKADVLAVVLPPAMLADLTNPRINEKPVIRAISKRVSTGKMVVNPATNMEEPEYLFQHDGWEQILKVVVETRLL